MSTILNLLNTEAPKDMVNSKRVMRDCVVELISTTLFVFAGTLSAVSTGSKLLAQGNVEEDVGRILPIAFTFGVTILCMAYSIGHLSGCHLNPGVSLLMYFRRQMSLPKMVGYWLCQFLGSIVGAALTWGCTAGLSGISKFDGGDVARPPLLLGSTTLNGELSTGSGFLLEIMGSFIFYFVIAQTALDQRGVANTPFPGIPIGLSLVVVHICLIPFTGCGVNPARSFGPAVVTCMSTYDDCGDAMGDWYWIYFVGPFAASFLVAEVTNLMQMDVGDDNEESAEDTDEGVEVAKEDVKDATA